MEIWTKLLAIVEVNSQTDFVAQNDKFLTVMSDVINHTFDNNIADAEAINASTINGEPFAEYLSLQVATIGEKLVVRRSAFTQISKMVLSSKLNVIQLKLLKR